MTTTKKSILFVHHRDITTPLGTTVPYYVSKTLADPYQVHVLCRTSANAKESAYPTENAQIHDLNTGDVPILSSLLFWLLSILYAFFLGLRYRYDVVYVFQMTLVQGLTASRVGDSRFVVGLQSVPVRQNRDFADSHDADHSVRDRIAMILRDVYATFVESALQRSSRVICLTDGIRALTEAEYEITLPNATVIGMGVAADAFSNELESHESPASSESWTVTYLGSISRSRGLEHVFEAIAECSYDIHLQIAGDGTDEYITELTEMTTALGIDDQVEWLGLVPHDDVPDLLASSDMALSPLPDIESYRISFPAKIFEYMAAGALVIASDIPPHRRFIDDGHTGFLYDGTQSGLRTTFERCIEGSDRHPIIKRRARQTAKTHDWDSVVCRHEIAMFT